MSQSFTTHRDHFIDTDYTCMQGTIQATPNQMIKAFGDPIRTPRDSRVSLEWRLKFADGTIATIYTWKISTPIANEPIVFHIGGRTGIEVTMVHQVFRKSEGLRAAA